MQKYEFLSVCGEGFYGTVFRSRVKGTKRVVAIKQFKGAEDYATKREIEVLSRLRHPNIIQLVEVLRPKGKLHMVFEFLDNDLLNILSKEYKEGMPENLVQSYIQQLCRGLEYCHERNIIHRDIKPENCLISGDHRQITDGSLKLCDFGEARVVHAGDKKLSAIIGTRWYRAPEILSGSKTTTSQTGSNAADCGSIQKVVRPKLLEYTNVSDLWGVGCIMGELLIGTPMYPADTDLQQLAVVKKFSTAPQLHKRMEQKNVTSEGMSLLTGLLTLAPAKRLTATTALAHPYYTNHGDGKSKVVKSQSSGDHGDGVVDEVDDSFDGDFSDVEDDDYTDDDAFDDEDTSMDDASRPDSPEVAIYNAVYKAPPLHHGKSEADSKPARQQATTDEASGKKHRRSKGKKKKDKRGAEEKTQNADKAEALEQLPPRHPKKKKKKHRQHKEDRAHKIRADKKRHKKSSKHTSHNRRNDDASTNDSRRHRRKREVPSYARATTAASVRSKSKSKASKDKKGSRKKRHHREKM